MSVALVSLVGLFVILGAVGLSVLAEAERRTQDLIALQRRIAAYQELQSNVTGLRFVVAEAFLEPTRRQIGYARRQIGQSSYDFDRALFVTGDESKLEEIRGSYEDLARTANEALDLIEAGRIAEARALQTDDAAGLADSIERQSYGLIAGVESDMIGMSIRASEEYARSQRILLATALTSVLIALGVGLLLTRTIVGPVRRINTRLKQIEAGAFEGSLPVTARDELGDLMANVNRMSGELERLYRDLAAASRHKSEFLATMSHEIRTPMNAITGMTELLLDSPLTREQKDFAATARDSAFALLSIINDVLDFSKIEAGELTLEAIRFDPRETIQSATDMIAHNIGPKDLELSCRIGPEVPAVIVGDPNRIRQILVNLLNNAVKFTESGEVRLNVGWEGLPGPDADGTLVMAIADTGIGISEEGLSRLFKAFGQVEASTTRRFGGTGLGLSISRRLARLMNGDITVDSTLGVGSEFTVRLRLRSAEPAPSAEAGRLSGARAVLLCDDEATNCALAGEYLDAFGMTVDRAADLDAARRRIETADVVVYDEERCPLAREGLTDLLAAARVPVVAMVRRGRSRPTFASAIVAKPLRPSQFRDSLLSAIGRMDNAPAPEAASVFDRTLAQRCPLTILLADDHPTNQKLGLMVLERLGYYADTAINGIEAVEATRHKDYDVILMDLHMPGMDGLDATRTIRAANPSGRPRVILMTADVLRSEWSDCEAAGAAGVIRKPIEVHALVAALTGAHAALSGAGLAPSRPPAAPGIVSGPTPAASAADVGLDRAALERLNALIGGKPELLVELVASFRSEAPGLIDRLSYGARHGGEEQRIAAHTLKASAADFGATRLRDLCAALEVIPAGTEKACAAVDEVRAEWMAVERLLVGVAALAVAGTS